MKKLLLIISFVLRTIMNPTDSSFPCNACPANYEYKNKQRRQNTLQSILEGAAAAALGSLITFVLTHN